MISTMRISNFWHKTLNRPYVLHNTATGSGPTVIFLHGIASSSATWSNLVPLLSPTHRCITIDLLGFGDSPKPAWSKYTINDHVRNIRRTILGLDLLEPYILVGHSLGGLLASRYTSLYPHEVSQLILLSPPVYLDPNHLHTKWAKNLTNAYLRAYKFLRAHKKFTLRNATFISRLLPANLFVINEATWIPFTRSLEECIETQAILVDINNVSAPIEVFYGTRDQFIVTSNLKMLGSVPGITMHELKGSDHVIREPYAQAVATSIASNEKKPRSSAYQPPPPPPPPPPPENPPPPEKPLEPELVGDEKPPAETALKSVSILENTTALKAPLPTYHSGGSE